METLTIKLLHERRSTNRRRKVEGKSGMTYPFIWSDEHKAYVFTTSDQEEADDLFNGQGRVQGSYFAPVLTMKKPEVTLSDETMMGLLEREITMPQNFDGESVALALLAAHDRGRVVGAKAVAKEVEHLTSAPARVETPATAERTVGIAVADPVVTQPAPATKPVRRPKREMAAVTAEA